MPAYVVALVDVHDPEGYREYLARVPATIAAHGGRYLARVPGPEALEGAAPGRAVVAEFPSVEQARRWHASAEYAPVKAIRERCARSTLLLLPGT